jgi:hypothetical protein
VFGGFGTGVYRNDTWEYDGADWVPRTPPTAPSTRSFFGMTFDGARGETVLFGGSTGGTPRSDTWVYQTGAVATVTDVGAGCAGSTGVPSLTAATPPWLGESLDLAVGNLPPTASVVLGLGASVSAWESFALPLALDFAGAPGCAITSALTVPLAIPSAGGTALWSTPIPADPALVGAVVYAQALVPDGAANPLGLVVSPSVCAVVGEK